MWKGTPPKLANSSIVSRSGSRANIHDSALEPQQAVEKAGFSSVRSATKNESDAFAQNAALTRSGEQLLSPAAHTPDVRKEFLTQV